MRQQLDEQHKQSERAEDAARAQDPHMPSVMLGRCQEKNEHHFSGARLICVVFVGVLSGLVLNLRHCGRAPERQAHQVERPHSTCSRISLQADKGCEVRSQFLEQDITMLGIDGDNPNHETL